LLAYIKFNRNSGISPHLQMRPDNRNDFVPPEPPIERSESLDAENSRKSDPRESESIKPKPKKTESREAVSREPEAVKSAMKKPEAERPKKSESREAAFRNVAKKPEPESFYKETPAENRTANREPITKNAMDTLDSISAALSNVHIRSSMLSELDELYELALSESINGMSKEKNSEEEQVEEIENQESNQAVEVSGFMAESPKPSQRDAFSDDTETTLDILDILKSFLQKVEKMEEQNETQKIEKMVKELQISTTNSPSLKEVFEKLTGVPRDQIFSLKDLELSSEKIFLEKQRAIETEDYKKAHSCKVEMESVDKRVLLLKQFIRKTLLDNENKVLELKEAKKQALFQSNFMKSDTLNYFILWRNYLKPFLEKELNPSQ